MDRLLNRISPTQASGRRVSSLPFHSIPFYLTFYLNPWKSQRLSHGTAWRAKRRMRRRGCSSLRRKWRNFHHKLAYRVEETSGMARVERRGGARGGLGQTGVVPGSDRLRRPAGCIVCASPPCRVRPMLHVLYLLPPEGPRPPLDHTRYARRQKFRAAAAASSSSPCVFPARCDAFIHGCFPLSTFYVSPGRRRGSTSPGDSCGNGYHTSCENITRFTRARVSVYEDDQRSKMDCRWEETTFCERQVVFLGVIRAPECGWSIKIKIWNSRRE